MEEFIRLYRLHAYIIPLTKVKDLAHQQKENTVKTGEPKRFPDTAPWDPFLLAQDVLHVIIVNHQDMCEESWFHEILDMFTAGSSNKARVYDLLNLGYAIHQYIPKKKKCKQTSSGYLQESFEIH